MAGASTSSSVGHILGRQSSTSFGALEDSPFWGRLSRIGVGALGELSEGNCLQGLGKDGWLLGTRNLSTNRRLSTFLGHLGIQTSRCFRHIKRFSSIGRLVGGDDDLSNF